MAFIIIETHGGAACAAICTDENGEILVFDCREEALAEALNCQRAIVLEL
jgi:hypothetical protein